MNKFPEFISAHHLKINSEAPSITHKELHNASTKGTREIPSFKNNNFQEEATKATFLS